MVISNNLPQNIENDPQELNSVIQWIYNNSLLMQRFNYDHNAINNLAKFYTDKRNALINNNQARRH